MDSKSNKKWIISISLVLVFSFFFGYYFCFKLNKKEKTKLEIIQDIMENEWYYGLDDDDIKSTLEDKMILSMLDLNKDPFTRYLTSLGSLADSYTGIGISVAVYDKYFIVDSVSSYSAMEDGIEVGDIIISINDISLENKSLDQISSIIGKEIPPN